MIKWNHPIIANNISIISLTWNNRVAECPYRWPTRQWWSNAWIAIIKSTRPNEWRALSSRLTIQVSTFLDLNVAPKSPGNPHQQRWRHRTKRPNCWTRCANDVDVEPFDWCAASQNLNCSTLRPRYIIKSLKKKKKNRARIPRTSINLTWSSVIQ